ncbi:glucose 1-dehydrogenase [Candidatus Aerophobetes bacterium]|uniref:Glucose 1-dehydrogenase n=1 Tax=Aerophobetes bacterium TaxID=2030807 RepID=A0A523W434_UNCAE|nr:MAG: glucose 1-dehydrogenase [Candidatus Aerophobetes bacterium]
MRLKDKVAIITGAGAGMGRVTAVLFSEEGARTVVVDIDEKAGQETVDMIRAKGQEALFISTDIADVSQVSSMVRKVTEEYGRLDILVNNAGVYARGDVVSIDEKLWDRIMNVNLRGAFLCCKYSIPEMIRNGGGTIVNVASECGIGAWKNQIVYNVSKAGLIFLTKSIAVDFASKNVRANCVCPGTTETPLAAAYFAKQPDPEKARRDFEEIRPANRLGRPEETAYGILYLASDESPYATGAVLSIDGGYTAQ